MKSSSRSVRLALGSLLFIAAAVLPLFRQSGIPSWQTIWAEDGSVFFGQASLQGGVGLLLRGYAGYLQLPTRLLGALSTLAPIRSLPLWLALSATIVTALLAWFTYWASAGWVASVPVRLALASLVVLMPAAGRENTASITNLIWIFVAVVPWALVAASERWRDIVICAAVAFFGATSSPLCFVFLPLALGYLLVHRTRATFLVAGALCAGLVVQGFVMHGGGILPSLFSNSVWAVADLLGERVFGMFLIGDKGIHAAWLSHTRLLTIGAPIAMAVLLVCLFPATGRRNQALASSFLAYAVICFVVPTWGRGSGIVPLFEARPRFGVIPELMLASAVALLIAPAGPGKNRVAARIARPVFVAHVAVLTVVGFSAPNLRSLGPAWPRALSKAYEKDCSRTASDKLVRVQTNRYNWWPVQVLCRDLAPGTAP